MKLFNKVVSAGMPDLLNLHYEINRLLSFEESITNTRDKIMSREFWWTQFVAGYRVEMDHFLLLEEPGTDLLSRVIYGAGIVIKGLFLMRVSYSYEFRHKVALTQDLRGCIVKIEQISSELQSLQNIFANVPEIPEEHRQGFGDLPERFEHLKGIVADSISRCENLKSVLGRALQDWEKFKNIVHQPGSH